MSGFLREHSWPIVFSVALHAVLAAALLAATLLSLHSALPKFEPIPVDAVVVDSRVLHAAQRALTERAEQEAARARAAADQKAAADAAAAQAAADAQMAAEKEKAAEQAKEAAAEVERAKQVETARATQAQKAAAMKHAEDLKRAEEAKHAEDAKRAADDAKRAADAKQADDAKRAADLKAKEEREAELRRQLADEEHRSAVEASPARTQYIARLAARIQNAWIKPASAHAGLDCVVNITQVASGEVTSAQVSHCNGDEAARQSVENAVYRASPLPLPSDPALFQRNLVIHFHPDE